MTSGLHGRSLDGASLIATCRTSCESTATIGSYVRLDRLIPQDVVACISRESGTGNIKSMTVTCSAPYVAGNYFAGCFSDVYVNGRGEATYLFTPTWAF